MPELTGHLVTPDGVLRGSIEFDSTIQSLSKSAQVDDRIVLPGIIDCHIHGGGGGDVMDGMDGIRQLVARTHARYGPTAFLATTVTADDASIDQVIEATKVGMRNRDHFRKYVALVHLEDRI